MTNKSSSIADDARLFAEAVVEAWLADETLSIRPAPAALDPGIESNSGIRLAHPERYAPRKGIPGQVYH